MTQNFILKILRGKLTLEPYPEELFKVKIPGPETWVKQHDKKIRHKRK